MSVVAHSPFTGNKRLFEEDAKSDSFDRHPSNKRGRFFGSPAGCRRASPTHSPQAACQTDQPFHPNTLAALRALFPGMDEQAVTAVLAECGNDIDAAIRRLTQLKIETTDPPNATGAAPSPPPQATPDRQQQPGSSGMQSEGYGAAGAAPAGPQTADDWVEALVVEMAAAKDIPDAKLRATKVLHAFEQFMSKRMKKDAGADLGGASTSTSGLQPRLEEVLRENAILKRAVQIQNARMQEAGQKEEELAGLRQMVAQYQERLRSLELSNYSLALHLQKATDAAAPPPNHRRPDVF